MAITGIRKAVSTDLEQLQSISRQTFLESYAMQNTTANMLQYLSTSLGKKQLQKELDHPHSHFYFAENKNDILGYLKVNFGEAQTSRKEPDSLEIERIYVMQAHHGRRIGKALLDHAIGLAHQTGLRSVWLGVWENNARAIGFYRKHGFKEFDRQAFRLGHDDQKDLVMRLDLQKD